MDLSTDTVERVGKTVEDAIEEALKILNVSREDAEIKIIEKGTKGFLGLIGTKPARVSVSKKLSPGEIVERFLQEISTAMGLSIKVTINHRDKHMYVNLTGESMGVLIGKRGQTLDSLQYLTNLVVNRCGVPEFSVILDTENYRKRRRETLESLALSLARKVKATRKNVVLEPMSRYERHVIHMVLQKEPYVRTYSDGNEPYRNVVIAPR